MNKITLSILALCFSVTVMAQEEASVLTNKKGIPMLPKAGDYAIGVEATPYLEYLGNMFNGTTDNTLDTDDNTLYGRYFLDDNSALRLVLNIDHSSNNYKNYVRDDNAYILNPLSNAQVVDNENYKNSGFMLGIGYQKFRGYGRLRGFYGAQVMFGTSSYSYEYTYGNPMTAANQTPTSSWSNGDGSRTLKENNGGYTTAGLSVLAGVEYYFAPKICIGGEINLAYMYQKGKQTNYTTEKWNGSAVVESTELNSPGSTYSSLETYSPSTFGGLYLMFHF
jgi:hypothetical protein